MSFTAVDNHFFELLPLLSGNELKILLSVIRKTYGWHKDSVVLKLKDFRDITGIEVSNVRKSIKTLTKKGFLKVTRVNSGLSYKFRIRINESKTYECYTAYTVGNCPFAKTGKEEVFCLSCPRYLIAKGGGV